MSLKEQIGEDIKTAMKAKDKAASANSAGYQKGYLRQRRWSLRPKGVDSLTPEQEIELLSQQAKQRRDSIQQFTRCW